MPLAVTENACRFEVCEVRRVPTRATHGYVLVVSPIKKLDKLLLVHERQVRLIERDGKKIESRQAKYVARVIHWDDDQEDTNAYNTLESAVQFVRQKKEDWDHVDEDEEDVVTECEWNIWKAIEISSEVDL